MLGVAGQTELAKQILREPMGVGNKAHVIKALCRLYNYKGIEL